MGRLATAAVLAAATTGVAAAGPVGRIGVVGGYDTSAPGHKDDGFAAGAGYRLDAFTAQLDAAYFDYNRATGVGGSATQLGVLLQARLFSAEPRPGSSFRPHFDFDVGFGRRWIRWEMGTQDTIKIAEPVIERQGRGLLAGVSATTTLFHFALHYVQFDPDPAPGVACHGTCPMQVQGSDRGVMFELGFVFGDH